MSLPSTYDNPHLRARRWESYWYREIGTDVYAVARAAAAVDNLERDGRGPLAISFQEARALAAAHGCRCHCHSPAPESEAS